MRLMNETCVRINLQVNSVLSEEHAESSVETLHSHNCCQDQQQCCHMLSDGSPSHSTIF